MPEDLIFDGRMVPAGVTAYMRHPDIDLFTVKAQVFRVDLSDILPVYITINTPERFECNQPVGHLQGTEITGMPYFITGVQVFQDSIIQMAVGIR